MIPASVDFVKAMKNPIKQMFIKLEFYDSKMKYIEEFTKKVTRNDIGSISVDLTRPVRRSFSFSLDNSNNEFTWGENNLVWIDKRIKLYIGLKLTNGQIEYVPQGVFILGEPQDSHGFDGKKVFVTGQDKMWLMTDKRGKFVNETTIETGTDIKSAIKLLAEKVGETMFNFDNIVDENGVARKVPYELTYSANDNIYKAIEELALLGRCTVYYDVHGYLRVRNIDLNEFDKLPAVWSYKYGDPTEKFYAGNKRIFDEEILANHIRVLGGSGQTAEVIYDLEVKESNSLWANSPYSIEKIGRITYFHNNGSPDGLITTSDEAKWRAKYELMNRLGYAERLELQSAPHFLFDAGDVIEVEDNENDVHGKYLLESLQVPLNPQLMTCACKKYRKIISDWNFI